MGNNIYAMIVARNSWHYLKQLIPQLLQEKGIDHVIVVDNGSTDGTITHCKHFFPSVFVIENKANLGFVKSINRGVQFALTNRATHILFLSAELLLTDNFLDLLVKKNTDIAVPIIAKQKNGKQLYAVGGKLTEVLRNPFYIWQSAKPPLSFNTSPQFASWSCLLIRRRVFDKIGYFDEAFISYYADILFFIHAKKAGLKIAIVPGALCQRNILVGKKERLRLPVIYKDRLLFVKKLTPKYQRILQYAFFIYVVIKMSILPKSKNPFQYNI